jgi:hypothetical protein
MVAEPGPQAGGEARGGRAATLGTPPSESRGPAAPGLAAILLLVGHCLIANWKIGKAEKTGPETYLLALKIETWCYQTY